MLTRNQLGRSDSLPKCLVIPGNLERCVKQDDLHVKIINLEEGPLR